jgi:hypothetical protein
MRLLLSRRMHFREKDALEPNDDVELPLPSPVQGNGAGMTLK